MTLLFCSKILRKFGFKDRRASKTQVRRRDIPVLEMLESRLTPLTCSTQGTILHVGAKEQYTSINAALAVVKPGQTIKVNPGTYVEQLNITTKNITIEGTGQNSIIEAPRR